MGALAQVSVPLAVTVALFRRLLGRFGAEFGGCPTTPRVQIGARDNLAYSLLVKEPTSGPDAVPGGTSNTAVGRAAAQRLIATFVQVDDPVVGAVVEHLSEADDERVAALLDVVLSDPDRLQVLRDSGLMDGPPDPALDRVSRMTAEALGTSLASVVLVDRDRQFLVGCNVPESEFPRSRPLDMSFSKYVVAGGRPMIVDNAPKHRLVARHAAVQSGVVLAYAGVPLVDRHGHAIGTLCTWDRRPRHWTSGQIQILTDLAQVAHTKVFRSLP